MGFLSDTVKKVTGGGGSLVGFHGLGGSGGGGAGAAGLASGNPWVAAGSMALDYFGQMYANQQNMDILQKQMAFQRNMSNTSYQRAVKDMIAAGLNPMLAYSQGGASTPSGGSATMISPTANAVRSLQQGMQVASAIDLQRAQTSQTAAQAELNAAQVAKVKAETVNEIDKNPALQKQVEHVQAQIENLRAGARQSSADAGRSEQNQRILSPLERVRNAVDSLMTSSANAAKTWRDQYKRDTEVYRSTQSNKGGW